MKKIINCNKCDAVLNSEEIHSEFDCINLQLEISKNEIERMKISLASWVNAWYLQRDAIVKMYWEIPHVNYMTRTEKDKLLSAARTIQETDEVQKLERRLPIDSE